MIRKIIILEISCIVITFCSCTDWFSPPKTNDQVSEYDFMMLKTIESYVNSYEPLHIIGQDTTVLGVFNYIPDSINYYLIESAKNNDFRALKYAYAVIWRQSEVIEGIATTPIVEHFIQFEPNGFVDLFVKAMGIEICYEKEDETRYGPDVMVFLACAGNRYVGGPIFYSDIFRWAENNKEKFDDWGYVEKYRKKLEKNKHLVRNKFYWDQ